MMRLIATTALTIAAVSAAIAALLPLTANEIALMLRSGYTNETVLHELSVRHFAGALDGAIEKQLVQAGAKPSLIDALRSGIYQAADSEITSAKLKSATAEENPIARTQRSEGSELAAQSRQPAATLPPDSIYSRLKGDLVYLHQGSMVPFDDEALEHKKFYLLFFSANWSAPGRKFTSQLVDYYNRVAPDYPEFEVIFFSADRSQFGMESYMTQSAMPWPALAFEKRDGKAGALLKNGLVREIPALILVDGAGNVLSYSHDGDKTVTIDQVLAETERLLRGVSGAPH